MKSTISIAILMGIAAIAVASPVASPGPPPKPMDDDKVGLSVASVGRCPVRLEFL